jgi:hypothetical protein
MLENRTIGQPPSIIGVFCSNKAVLDNKAPPKAPGDLFALDETPPAGNTLEQGSIGTRNWSFAIFFLYLLTLRTNFDMFGADVYFPCISCAYRTWS